MQVMKAVDVIGNDKVVGVRASVWVGRMGAHTCWFVCDRHFKKR